jgi:hypothetical protein
MPKATETKSPFAPEKQPKVEYTNYKKVKPLAKLVNIKIESAVGKDGKPRVFADLEDLMDYVDIQNDIKKKAEKVIEEAKKLLLPLAYQGGEKHIEAGGVPMTLVEPEPRKTLSVDLLLKNKVKQSVISASYEEKEQSPYLMFGARKKDK